MSIGGRALLTVPGLLQSSVVWKEGLHLSASVEFQRLPGPGSSALPHPTLLYYDRVAQIIHTYIHTYIHTAIPTMRVGKTSLLVMHESSGTDTCLIGRRNLRSEIPTQKSPQEHLSTLHTYIHTYIHALMHKSNIEGLAGIVEAVGIR